MPPITEYLNVRHGKWVARFTYTEKGQLRDRRFRLGAAHTGRGRPRRGTLSEAMAREQLAARRAALEAELGYAPAERGEREGTTVRDLALARLDDAGFSSGRPWAPSTKRDYVSALGQARHARSEGHILSVLGDVTLDELSPAIVRTWWKGLDDLGARNANKQLTIVRRILAWANEDGRFGRVEDATSGIRKRRETDTSGEAPRFFEHDEFEAILAAAQAEHEREAIDPNRRGRALASMYDVDIFTLMAHTGMRRGEVAALRVGDVDLDFDVVTIRSAVSAGELNDQTKSHRARRVAMTDQARDILTRRAAA